MFQNYALFPHMSVAKNIGYGLARLTASLAQTMMTALRNAKIGAPWGFGHRKPDQLSGGQKQRFQARAHTSSQIIIIGRAFGSLDKKLREIHNLSL